ncbi:hypothetical protein D1007_04816 [Hordeum vulgare]|nr:hypothetical protein D1007_04816 [Hordeum vulgare]
MARTRSFQDPIAVGFHRNTDSEEEEENDDMLIEEEYDGEDMPQIEWNRDNPNLNAGTIYKNMTELQNALTMYCIHNNNVYGTKKNEKRKMTMHCLDPSCSWKLHATGMRGKKAIQIRYNNNLHTCPAKEETHKSKLATKNWLAEVMTLMLRKDPSIGANALGKKISEIYGFEEKLPYMRLWTIGMVALQNINGRVCSNVVPVGFGNNDAYQVAATAPALKAAKAAATAVSAWISKKGKTK